MTTMTALALAAACLAAPVDGPISAGFAPEGRYAGHWGIDFRVGQGTQVRSVADGVVTFAGTVVANRTVTVADAAGRRISYSYLAVIMVSPGMRVRQGHVLGLSGMAHGEPALHLSIRVGSEYVDPAPLLSCVAHRGGILRLLSVRDR